MTQWKWRDNLKQRNSHSRRGKFCTPKADGRNLYLSSVGSLCLLATGYMLIFIKWSERYNCFCFTLISLIPVGASAESRL